MALDLTFNGRLRVPLIVAPMFLVSNPALTLAACSRGVMGSFPAHSTRTREVFIEWLDEMERGLGEMDAPAPWAVNLVVHPTNQRYEGDLALCVERKVPVILTSKGAPDDVFKRIHDYGGVAFHDIASARHAEKAVAAGADGSDRRLRRRGRAYRHRQPLRASERSARSDRQADYPFRRAEHGPRHRRRRGDGRVDGLYGHALYRDRRSASPTQRRSR